MRGKYLNVTSADKLDVAGKAVLVRGDLDVENQENPRVESVRRVVELLRRKGAARIRVIGHRETKYPVCDQLRGEFPGVEFDDQLRADPGERANDADFAKKLALGWDAYVNEAFASSHREHASLSALPRLMRSEGKLAGLGPRFILEMRNLDRVAEMLEGGYRSVLVIGGVKVEDKEKFASEMGDRFTKVLKGGLLPGVRLRPDGLDISQEAIREYVANISQAELILAAGVMGKYEEEDSSEGTEKILTAIAENERAYKVAGGGDIEAAISRYGLTSKFDWISVGGGAMLKYISKGTLPALEVLAG